MEIPKDYGERLQDAMTAAGVGITALADHLGVSYQAVKKVLNGGSKSLAAENNAKAAALLGCSGDWLATGEGPRGGFSAPARKIAELLDRLGPPDSLRFLTAYQALRQVLDEHAEQPGPRPISAPHQPATATHARAKEKPAG